MANTSMNCAIVSSLPSDSCSHFLSSPPSCSSSSSSSFFWQWIPLSNFSYSKRHNSRLVSRHSYARRSCHSSFLNKLHSLNTLNSRCKHVCRSWPDQASEGGKTTALQEGEDACSLSPEGVSEDDEKWKWRTTTRELIAYGLLCAAVPLGSLLPRFQYSGPFYFAFLAIWSVYVGSHRSLQRMPPQKMSLKQGLAVPFMCSFSLFGLYCLLRFYPDIDIQTFISIYLGFAGSLAVASNVAGPVRYILPDKEDFSWRINIPEWLLQDDGQPVHFTLTAADCISLLVGIGSAIVSRQNGAPFTMNNFVAVCIVTELLNLLSLGSFITAAVMLCGLLLYDVFWVFGSPHVFGDNVMLTVATSTAIEGPMKLIFPSWNTTAANPYSVLGLGDVAAPGLLIALMLRFDRSRSSNAGSTFIIPDIPQTNSSQRPDKTYFLTCMVAYLVGLAITIGIVLQLTHNYHYYNYLHKNSSLFLQINVTKVLI
ncbi:hypothetical protein KP509_1Z102100 [Ceratopteris richardii]|nr:hypothetical protein KP509_1Z102100 [Ceratopteris richardii]